MSFSTMLFQGSLKPKLTLISISMHFCKASRILFLKKKSAKPIDNTTPLKNWILLQFFSLYKEKFLPKNFSFSFQKHYHHFDFSNASLHIRQALWEM